MLRRLAFNGVRVGQLDRDVSIDGHETRGLLHCTLRLPSHPTELHAICVHLGLRESHRRQQLALLSEVIRDHVPAAAEIDLGQNRLDPLPRLLVGRLLDDRQAGPAKLRQRDPAGVDRVEHCREPIGPGVDRGGDRLTQFRAHPPPRFDEDRADARVGEPVERRDGGQLHLLRVLVAEEADE